MRSPSFPTSSWRRSSSEERRSFAATESYGVPLAKDVASALESYRPELVVDLSDEPVLGPVERFALASRVLTHGIPYVGADFRFDPPRFEPSSCPPSRWSERASVSARPL